MSTTQSAGNASNPEWLYAALTGHLSKLQGTALHKRIMEHLKVTTGFSRLDLFKMASSQRQQIETFTTLLSSAMGKDFSALMQERNEILPADIQITVIDSRGGTAESLRKVEARDKDSVMATLLELLTKPGVSAKVSIQVTILDPKSSA